MARWHLFYSVLLHQSPHRWHRWCLRFWLCWHWCLQRGQNHVLDYRPRCTFRWNVALIANQLRRSFSIHGIQKVPYHASFIEYNTTFLVSCPHMILLSLGTHGVSHGSTRRCESRSLRRTRHVRRMGPLNGYPLIFPSLTHACKVRGLIFKYAAASFVFNQCVTMDGITI